ncbi:MAG: spore gernimation protein [Firmicutes bacterium]|nr:spore gernimation protein [Bacillota bacterium]
MANPHSWRRVVAWALLLALSLGALTGCWDDKSLDTRTLVLAMGFYPARQPGEVAVYFAVPTPAGLTSDSGSSSSGGASGPPLIILQGVGHSIGQAFSAAQASTNRDLYLGHTVFLLFSTKLSPFMLRRLVNALDRIGTLDKTPFVAATSAPFAAVLGTIPQEHFPPLYYEELFSCTTCQQLMLGVRFWQMSDRLWTPGVDLVLPVLKPTRQGPAVDEVALYRNTRYVATLTPKETTAYGIAAGRSRKTSLFFPRLWDANLDFVADKARVSTEVVHGRLQATLAIHATATLESIATATETAGQVARISRRAARLLADEAAAFVRLSQRDDVDALGFGRALAWAQPQVFARYRHWHRVYPHLTVAVRASITVNRLGDLR